MASEGMPDMVLMIQNHFICKKHNARKKTLFLPSLKPFHCILDQKVPLTENSLDQE